MTQPGEGIAERSRRGLLRTAAGGTVAAGVAASATGRAAAQGGPFDGWLSEDDTFDGTVVDETGTAEVTITVGAEGNDGSNAFGPSAVRVDPGTTVVWEWTGNGFHNVVGENRDVSSGSATDEAGTTYRETFEEAGTVKYYCQPHRGLGMRGVVVVGGESGGNDGSESSGEHSEGGDHGEEDGRIVFTPELQAWGAFILMGLLSPLGFAVLLKLRQDPESTDTGRSDEDLRRIE